MDSDKTHPSVIALYAAARERDDTSPAAIARTLNISAQRLQNWAERGISKEGALTAQKLYAADANALLDGKFRPMATKSTAPGAPREDADDLRHQVESLTIVLASMVGLTAKHRPLEGEELAQLIKENRSLVLSRHDLALDILDMLGSRTSPSAKPTAPGRKRSAS